jgi:putative tricarboxylic transport membrane protein
MATGRGLRIGEAVLGGGLLALGLFVGIETALLEVAPTQATVGPRLFPSLVAAGLVAVSLALLREALFAGRGVARGGGGGGWELDWPAVALVSAGLVAAMLLMEPAGWVVAATLLFVGAARAFGSRRPALDAVVGLVLAGLTFAVFNYGLGLGLPGGRLVEMLEEAGDGDAG